MDLYFSPLACSMATRIALYEAGAPANFIEVDPKTKKVLKDNSDFYAINALGLVPVVRTDDGAILTENAAILQHVAERLAGSNLGAGEGLERSRLHDIDAELAAARVDVEGKRKVVEGAQAELTAAAAAEGAARDRARSAQRDADTARDLHAAAERENQRLGHSEPFEPAGKRFFQSAFDDRRPHD